MIRTFIKYYYVLFVGCVFATFTNNETGWSFIQSTDQSFYVFESISIDGETVVGNGAAPTQSDISPECFDNLNTCDVVGAFINRDENDFGVDFNEDGELTDSVDICIGWAFANSEGWTTVPLMGTQGNDLEYINYLDAGDVPFLLIYDSSTQSILPLDNSSIYYTESFEDCGYDNICPDDDDYPGPDGGEGNGAFDEYFPAEDFTDCDEEAGICEDEEGWSFFMGNGSYDEGEPFDDANGNGVWDDEGEEEYIDLNDNGVYDGDVFGDYLGFQPLEIFLYYGGLTAENIGGCIDESACNYDESATIDDASCDYPEENFDCDGNCAVDIDCFGECGGDAVVDECDECGGDGIDDGECDCDGNIEDCFGECGGDAVLDECDECNGNGIDEGFCDCLGNILDCANQCGGSASYDPCGVCDENPANDCVLGCTEIDACNYNSGATVNDGSCEYPVDDGNGNYMGNFENQSGTVVFSEIFDCFGNCIVDIDCDGLCDGDSALDDCGVCEGGNADMDCTGVCFGDSALDDCGVCEGGNADMDCAGVCDGDSALDDCGVCEGDNADMDCTGVCFGDAVVDECGVCNGGNTDMDDCGVCNGDNADNLGCGCFEPGPSGCDDECGSTLEFDECGVCGGDGPEENFDCDGNCIADFDCADICGGSAEEDDCEVCDDDPLNDCVLGCTDDTACNYNETATTDDDTCILPPMGDISLEYVTIETGNTIQLSWVSPSSGSGEFTYEVVVENSEGNPIYSEYDLNSPVIISNLEWLTTYTASVIVTNDIICDPLISSVTVEIGPMPAPGEVTLDDPVVGEGEVSLSWDSVDFAYIYNIYNISDENNQFIGSTTHPITTYHHSNLAPSTTYSYVIQAVNYEGTVGLSSNIESATTDPLAQISFYDLDEGPGEINLEWDMDADIREDRISYTYAEVYYVYDIYETENDLTYDGVLYDTNQPNDGTTYTASSLELDINYCFYITPRIELTIGEEIQEFTSESSEILCGIPEEISGWYLLMEAQIEGGWGGADQLYANDRFNRIGMHPDATNGYDDGIDIPEPPSDGTNYWISLSYPHPEWDIAFGGSSIDNFTQEVRDSTDLLRTVAVWDLDVVYSEPGGSVSILFDFISDAGGYPIFIEHDDYYQRITDASTILFQGQPLSAYPDTNNLSITIGNQSPYADSTLHAEMGEPREMNLSWDGFEECLINNDACDNYASRYPPTSYKIHRQWYEDNTMRLIGVAGSVDNKIALFPHEFLAEEESQFSIGDISPECFEDEDEDCGWDGLCPGDDGYESSDLGEGDGICNQVYYYNPLDSGSDTLSYANGIYDFGESFEDDNNNEEWDQGEVFIDSTLLSFRITDSLESFYIDGGLRTGMVYSYKVSGSNIAGDSGLSNVASATTAANQPPTADAGENQTVYLLESNQNSEVCTLPLSIVGVLDYDIIDVDTVYTFLYDTVNFSSDSDDLDGEELSYSWQIKDSEDILDYHDGIDGIVGLGDNWWEFGTNEIQEVNLVLPENSSSYEYLVRLQVQDVSFYASSYDSISVIVTKDIPVPAEVENFEAEEDLYYIGLTWDISAYDPPGTAGGNPPDDPNYNGILELADNYVVYRSNPISNVSDTTFVQHALIEDSEVIYLCSDTGEPFDSETECNLGNNTGWDGCVSTCEKIFEYIDEDLSPGEPFVDLNNNGKWDDARCYIDETTCISAGGFFENCNCVVPDEDLLNSGTCISLGGIFSNPEEYSDLNYNGERDYTETRCYYIVAFNGIGSSEYCDYSGNTGTYIDCDSSEDFLHPSNLTCFETGELPIPTMTSPCGGEILASGSIQEVTWDISDAGLDYIESIDVYQSNNAGGNWSHMNSDFTISTDGTSYSFTVNSTPTILFYTKFKIEVTDVGNYAGDYSGAHLDDTDHLIIIASNELECPYNPGFNIISSPLALSNPIISSDYGNADEFVLYDEWGGVCIMGGSCDDEISLESGNGLYIRNLSSDNSVILEFNGDDESSILSESTLHLNAGWNLIGNPLVAKFPIEWIDVNVLGTPNVILTWADAVNSNIIQPAVFGFNNESREHESVDILEPFFGYWIHASQPLDLDFVPRAYDESLYSGSRGNHFDITLHAEMSEYPNSNYENGVWNDFVKLGISEGASDGFNYGEDQYDLHEYMGNNMFTVFTNLYIHHPGDGLDSLFFHGFDGEIQGERFHSDFRPLASDSTKIWSIKGQALGQEVDEIRLSWDIDNQGVENIDDYDVILVAGDHVISMRDSSSAVVAEEEFSNMKIMIGSLLSDEDEDSCDNQGLLACEDGTCISDISDCTCEQQFQAKCTNGDCVATIDECSCAQQFQVECANGDCIDDISNCSCVQQNLYDCGEGVCVADEDQNGLINDDDCPVLSIAPVPDKFSISSPYPNPFNPSVKIDFSLPVIDNIDINIYDINGNLVKNLMSGFKSAGYYTAFWDASSYPTGMYFVHFSSNNISKTMKVVLIK